MNKWMKLLLEDDVSSSLSKNIETIANEHIAEFVVDNPRQVPMDSRAALNRWYDSDAGQSQLFELFMRIWMQASTYGESAMPAHDARHSHYKVPATALELVASEGIRGYERVGVFAAFLHDHGRWAEERIFGQSLRSDLHAKLSFLIAREMLETTAIPSLIKSQILYAVLLHTAGITPASTVVCRLTMAADREQLHGPEIVLRTLHYTADGAPIYGTAGQNGVIDKIRRFNNTIGEFPSSFASRESTFSKLSSITRSFLVLATETSKADECAPEPALIQLLSAPHVAPNTKHVDAAIDRIRMVPEDKKGKLGAAIAWASHHREQLDAKQKRTLKNIAKEQQEDYVVTAMARALLLTWDHSPAMQMKKTASPENQELAVA